MVGGLALAASPVFAVMTLLTALYDDTQHLMCGSGNGMALNGMATMYLLMCAAHLPPWLKLLACRRRGLATEDH